MSAAAPTAKRLESEVARVFKIMEHVRDRPEGLNEADTKAAFIDPVLSALGWSRETPSQFPSSAATNFKTTLVIMPCSSSERR